MTVESLFEARLDLRVGDLARGPWALPSWESVSVGRLPGAGLHLRESWVPSRLCRLIPYESGWILQSGRARARVENKYIGTHTYGSRAVVALQPGASLIGFPELDDYLRLRITVGADVVEGLDVLQDDESVRGEERRTVYAAGSVEIAPTHRRVLAVVYLHLLTRTKVADNVALAAAQRLGKSEQAVKNVLTDVRRKVNRERWLDLQDSEQLGHYLVRLTRTISWEDLPPELQQGLPG